MFMNVKAARRVETKKTGLAVLWSTLFIRHVFMNMFWIRLKSITTYGIIPVRSPDTFVNID